jgi:membrane peptidoglycan carboxypeptidase
MSLAALLGGLTLLGLAAALGVGLFAVSRYRAYASGVVPPERLLSELPRGGARIYDRNGVRLYEFVDEFGGLRRPVALADISEHLRRATIATEDASFYANNGLNTRGLMRAAYENFSPFGGDPFSGSGGSSITQQLAKNVYIPKEQRAARSVDRKLRETVIALELTKRYSKDQILEWYLNSISYGGVYVGIQAAALGYFGKPASELTLAESALLAGIPQSPLAYEPIQNPERAKARQAEVLGIMVRHGVIAQEQADAAAAEELAFQTARFDIDAPHFVLGPVARELEARYGARALYEDGLEVTTSLDVRLQRAGEAALEKYIREFEATANGHNGALMAVDPKNGQVLAYIGSRDYFRDDIQGRNNNITALNSPGSTLKPFTYIAAFQQGWGTGTAIIDSPAKVIDPSTGQPFSPRNPNGAYNGVVTAASALGNSLNVPAFKTIIFAGVDNVVNLLKQSGLTTLNDERGYGPALTLGGVDVRLDDLTFAYSVLAGSGTMRGQQPVTPHRSGERTVDPVVLLKVADANGRVLHESRQPVERRIMTAPYAYLATSILSDAQQTCITFNCAGLSLPDRPSAAKTGTSEPFENSRAIGETWTFGYTQDLVAGIWAGNADNSPMQNIVSTSISWRAWRDFMQDAHRILELPARPFVRPTGVEEREVCWPSGRLPTDACPNERRYRSLLASEAIPTDKEKLAKVSDSWWQKLRIDTRTGQVASASAPAQYVREEVRLVFPKEELEAWPGLREWAVAAGLGGRLGPSVDGAESASFVSIATPAPEQTVSGQLVVGGRAASPDFQRYVLEWGRGRAPTNWVQVGGGTGSVLGGALGSWDTRLVENGPYMLRVRVLDAKRGELRDTVAVTVLNAGGQQPPAGGTPGARIEPVAQITTPSEGATISGPTVVTGVAIAGQLLDVTLEVGAGAQPAQWTLLRRDSTPVANSPVGIWDPTGLTDGLYTLRLTVRDRVLGSAETTVAVVLRATRR